MLSFWELYNFKYMNNSDLVGTENSEYSDDCEILIEVDGNLFECQIADLEETDGQLVLKVGEKL